MLRIDRCVCLNRSFSELKELAKSKGLDFAGLRAATGCGTGCGLCVPYVKVMLRTGQTEFRELIHPSSPLDQVKRTSCEAPVNRGRTDAPSHAA